MYKKDKTKFSFILFSKWKIYEPPYDQGLMRDDLDQFGRDHQITAPYPDNQRRGGAIRGSPSPGTWWTSQTDKLQSFDGMTASLYKKLFKIKHNYFSVHSIKKIFPNETQLFSKNYKINSKNQNIKFIRHNLLLRKFARLINKFLHARKNNFQK